MGYVNATEDMVELVKELVKAHHGHLEGMKIAVIARETAATKDGKTVFGTAGLVPKKVRPLLKADYDFIIVLALDVWDDSKPERRRIMVDHELSHCGKNEDGSPKMKPHDLEEFATIVKRYGAWRDDTGEERVKQAFLFHGDSPKVDGPDVENKAS